MPPAGLASPCPNFPSPVHLWLSGVGAALRPTGGACRWVKDVQDASGTLVTPGMYEALPLGKATTASGLAPYEALCVKTDLEKARKVGTEHALHSAACPSRGICSFGTQLATSRHCSGLAPPPYASQPWTRCMQQAGVLGEAADACCKDEAACMAWPCRDLSWLWTCT